MALLSYDMKRVLGGLNAKFGKDSCLYPVCGRHSLHNKTNDKGKQMVNFALGRDLTGMGQWCQHENICKVTWRSPDNKICNHLFHIFVDRKHRTNVCDMRSMRGAEIE
jgi:hypothetical protein